MVVLQSHALGGALTGRFFNAISAIQRVVVVPVIRLKEDEGTETFIWLVIGALHVLRNILAAAIVRLSRLECVPMDVTRRTIASTKFHEI